MVRPCEACHASDFKFLLEEQVHKYHLDGQEHTWGYNLAKCQNCGLVFIDPKPDWSTLQTFYDEEYGSYDASIGRPETEAFSLKYRLASWRYPGNNNLFDIVKQGVAIASEWVSGKTISYSLSLPLALPKDAAIFEMGFGSGNWLRSMAMRGYTNLYGYDIDVNQDNLAKLKEDGIKVSDGIFLENDYPENFFDCIRLEHVFEHLRDPDLVLEKCWQMLKPNGILVMNFPSGDSITLDVSLEHSALRQSPKHLFLYTKRSTEIFLKRANFTNIIFQQNPVVLQYARTVNVARSHDDKPEISERLFTVISPLYRIFGLLIKRGDFISIVASKP